MDTNKFDNEIKRLEGVIEQLKTEMESIAGSYLRATATRLVEFAEEHVAEAVKLSGKAEQLGPSGLKRVKKDLQQLTTSITGLVEENMNRPSCWSHRQSDESVQGQSVYGRHQTSGRRSLSEGEGRVVSHVGKLLATHDLLGGVDEYWTRDYSRGMSYQYGVGSSGEMTSLMEKYNLLDKSLVDARHALLKEKEDRQHAVAEDLWHSA